MNPLEDRKPVDLCTVFMMLGSKAPDNDTNGLFRALRSHNPSIIFIIGNLAAKVNEIMNEKVSLRKDFNFTLMGFVVEWYHNQKFPTMACSVWT